MRRVTSVNSQLFCQFALLSSLLGLLSAADVSLNHYEPISSFDAPETKK